MHVFVYRSFGCCVREMVLLLGAVGSVTEATAALGDGG